jgi:hypothetical protein
LRRDAVDCENPIFTDVVAPGEDILVVASTPSQCSEIVHTLSTLFLPVSAFEGDCRPYMTNGSSDVDVLKTITAKHQVYESKRCPNNNIVLKMSEMVAQKSDKQKKRTSGILVGTDDGELVKSLDRVGVVIFVSQV